MTQQMELELIDACRILFPAAEINREFLQYIQPEGLKNAYRNRAWESHPDAFGNGVEHDHRTELFRRSSEAYTLLNTYIRERRHLIPLRAASSHRTFTPQIIRERSADEQYYDGSFPTIELKTALFLYYRGAVSYQAVVKALIWQRDMRPPLGDFACKWGWMGEQDVAEILAATSIVGSFGERAVKMGYLTPSQLNILLLQQRTQQQPVGRYFVMNALVSEWMLQSFLRDLSLHNREVRESRR